MYGDNRGMYGLVVYEFRRGYEINCCTGSHTAPFGHSAKSRAARRRYPLLPAGAPTAQTSTSLSRRPRFAFHARVAARRGWRVARTARIVLVRVLDDPVGATVGGRSAPHRPARGPASQAARTDCCLLYTSDAADEE